MKGKRFQKSIIGCLLLVLLLAVSVGVTACGKKEEEPQPAPPQPAVTLDVTEVSLDVYETTTLQATVTNSDQTVVWTSSDPAIATVVNGKVTGVSEGSVTVTAKIDGASATCAVTVYNSYTAPVLKLERTYIPLPKEETYRLSVDTIWKGVPIDEPVSYTVTRDLDSEEGIATAELASDGKSIVVTAVEYGQVDFYVSASVRGVDLVQKFTVRVNNVDITFAIDNVGQGDGKFTAALSLIATDNDTSELTPNIKIFDKNDLVEGASVALVSDDANIVKVDNGKLIAVSTGETEVRGSYEGSEFIIACEVYRPTIALKEKVYFEMYRLAPKKNGVPTEEGKVSTVTLPAPNDSTVTQFVGVAQDATVGKVNVMTAFDSAKSELTVDASKLPNATKDMGDTTFVLNTDKAVFTADAAVVTQAIRTQQEFGKWHEVAKQQDADKWYWDGYFVLANDIDYNAQVYERYWNFDIAVSTSDDTHKWQDGNWLFGLDSGAAGFRGVFDGQGYTIDNMQILVGGSGSIFGVLTSTGVVRNLSITGLTHYGQGSVIISGGAGVVENIYIQCDKIINDGTQNDGTTFLCQKGLFGAMRIRNCVVQNDANITDMERVYGIGSVRVGYGVIDNVYCVGVKNGVWQSADNWNGDDKENGSDVFGVYSDYAELQKAHLDLSNWNRDFWAEINGIPMPKNITVDTDVQITDTSNNPIAMGTTYKVTASGSYKKFSVDIAAANAGITISGDGVLSVPEDCAVSFVTVTVASIFDATKTDSKTYGILHNTTIDVAERQDVEYRSSGEMFTLDLTGQSIEGSLASAKIGNQAFKSYIANGLSIELDKETLKNIYGDQTIDLTFNKTEQEQLVEITTVHVPICAITQIIDDEAELNSFVKNGYGLGGNAFLSEGYYVLGENITCTGTYASTYCNASGAGGVDTTGFAGTFDGRGKVIDGLHITGGLCGFMWQLTQSGVIRNVSFINAVHQGTGGFLVGQGMGTIENVFVQVKATPNGKGWDGANAIIAFDPRGELRTRNIIIEYMEPIYQSDGKTNGFPFWCYYTNNAQDVYAIGTDAQYGTLGDGASVGDTFGVYRDYAAMQTAQIDFSAWSTEFWTVKSRLPVPKGLLDKATVTISAASDPIATGSSFDTNATGVYKTFAVDSAASAAGVTVDGFGIITVPQGCEASAVTITVTSLIDGKTATATYTVLQNIALSTRQDVEWKGEGETFTIDLTATGVTDIASVESAKIGDTEFATKTVEGSIVTLDRETLKNVRGEQTITLLLTRTGGGKSVVTVPVTSITQIIDTNAEFLSWYTVAKELGADAKHFDGYFVLGKDLTFYGESWSEGEFFNAANYWNFSASQSAGAGDQWLNGNEVGFAGTFDGRGHVLDKLFIFVPESGSLFGVLTSTGVVKNIVLTNLVHNGQGAVIVSGGIGTVENVYIHCSTIKNDGDANNATSMLCAKGILGALRIKNCYVQIDESAVSGKTGVYGIGGVRLGSGVLNNVYCVGANDGVWKSNQSWNMGDVENGTDKYASYATCDAMKAANISVTEENGWDISFWTTDADGLPVPKTLKN